MTTQIDPSGPDGTAEPSPAPAPEPAAAEPAPVPAGPAPVATTPFLPFPGGATPPGLGAEGAAGLRALARLARQSGNADEAIARYREAAFLDPDDPAAAIETALYDAELGRHREAVATLERSVRRHPDLPALRFHLGVLWGALAEPEKAGIQLRRCLALDPDDLLGAGAALTALSSGSADLPPTYLRALFDQYADDFERNLIEDLGYRAPELLRSAVDRCWRAPAGGADMLDLGCGTGLGAAAFRDLVRRVDGVDLSPRMIEKAASRGIYDSLAVGDAVAAMVAAESRWDLILAADVLVYMGDMQPVFAAAARALRTGGAFAATTESGDGAEPMLKPTRRFGHPASYLRQVAGAAGLRVALLEPASARAEKGEAVAGHVLLLIKDG